MLSYCLICCHTERSEVSINSKCVLKFFGFFATACALQAVFSKKNSVASQKTLNFKAFAIKFTNFLNFSQNLAKIQHKKAIIYESVLENSKKDEPLRANFTAFENVSYHLNATPLSVEVLVPCAWSKILACGGAWQRVLNSAELGVASLATKRQSVAKFNGTATKFSATNSVWQTFAGKTAHSKFGLGKRGENGAVFGRGTSLSLSLSRCSHFLAH